MKATLDSLCYEMEKSTTKVEVQIKCIDALATVLKSERDLESFQHALNCVSTAIRNNDADVNVIIHALNLFTFLIQIQRLSPLLEQSDIVRQHITIIDMIKDDPQISITALNNIEFLIKNPQMQEQFQDELFVKTLISLLRLHTKSEEHAKSAVAISQYLNPELGKSLKKLCSLLVIFSQNFADNENLQTKLLISFLNIANDDILSEKASIALPHFVRISQTFTNNFSIFQSVLTLANRCPSEYCPKVLINLILANHEKLLSNRDSFQEAISVLYHKFKGTDLPPEIAILTYNSLIILSSDAKSVKQSLAVCYYVLSKNPGYLPPDTDLLSAISSVLLIHLSDSSVVRRSSVLIHSLIDDKNGLINNSITQLLLKSAYGFISDSQTLSIALMSLSSFINSSKLFGSQLSSTENVQILHKIINDNKDEARIVSQSLVILRAIVLSKYEFEAFCDLPSEKKEMYQVKSSICEKAIKASIDDLIVVKSAILLMSPDGDDLHYLQKAMKKYSSDREIVISGLVHKTLDLNALTAAVLLCKEDSLRYALPIIEKTKELLPTQLIEFLLSLDRADVVDALLVHVDRKSCDYIGNQFQLSYVSQIQLAFELYQKNLFEPQESDYEVLLQGLYESMFKQKQLSASLFFLKQFGVDDSTYSFLINAIKQHSREKDIVEQSAEFIIGFEPTGKIMEISLELNAVSIVTNTMELHRNDKSTIEVLMKLMHFLSYYQPLDIYFVKTLSIPIIIGMAKNYSNCIEIMCSIFSNMVRDVNIANYLVNLNISSVIFKKFGRYAYTLLVELLEQYEMKITNDQFEIILKQLTSKGQPTACESLNLLKIIQICYQMNLHPKKHLSSSSLLPFLNVYPNEPLIIQIVCQLLPETRDYQDNDDLLFALLEALRSNRNDQDVVFTIIPLIPKFTKQKNTLNAPATVDLMLKLVELYKSNGLVAQCAFELLKDHPESFPAAISSLNLIKDKEAVLVIAQCIVSYCNAIDPSESLGQVLRSLKNHSDHREICSYLTQVVFFCSTNEQTDEALIKYINVLISICMKFVDNINICRAVIGVVCNLANTPHYFSQLYLAPACIIMALKSHPKDEQLITASCSVISSFALSDKGRLFVDVIPVLILSLKNRIKLELICQTLADMGELASDYASSIAEELMKLIGKEQNKFVPANSLFTLSLNEKSHDAIFAKLSIILDLISSKEDEDLGAILLGICANLKDRQKLKQFDPFVPQLITIIRGSKGKLQIPAANCCFNLARYRPELLLQYIDTFRDSSKNELGRICGLINEELQAPR